MSLFVLDASVAVAWLLGEQTRPEAEMALVRLQYTEALVPQLSHLELRNCLLVAMRRGGLATERPTDLLDALLELPIRTDTNPDLSLALVLAEKHRLSFFGAVYLELAKRHAVPLATLDRALTQAADAEGVPLVCTGTL